jgi:HK97 family phage major capsid protein
MRDLLAALDHLSTQIDDLADDRPESRTGSRFVGQGATRAAAEHAAAESSTTWRTLPSSTRGIAGLMTKALAEGTGSAGGFLVPVEVAAEVLTILRSRSAVMRMGPRIVPVEKELDVVSLASGATAAYVSENFPIPTSEQTFAESVLLRPKELAALVPVSDRLLRDAADSPDVEEVVREDLAEVLGLRADLAFLRGTGTTEPLGVRNASGLTAAPNLGANGAAPTFDNLKDMVANLRAANAPFERPGWIFNPRTINTLEKVKDGQGRYLADAGLLTFDRTGGGGTLLGFPFRTSTQIPINLTTGSSTDTSEIYFSSDWQECWIGENEELRIEISGEAAYTTDGGTTWISAFQNRQHLFRATWSHDLGLRRPSLFSVMTGVRP